MAEAVGEYAGMHIRCVLHEVRIQARHIARETVARHETWGLWETDPAGRYVLDIRN